MTNEYDDLLDKPTGSQNEYEDFLDQDRQLQKSTLQQSMFVAAKEDPERKARVLALSERTNLPAAVVDRNLDEVSRKADQSSFEYDALIDKTPSLAKFLENPDNAALAKDDLEALGKIEKGTRGLKPKSTLASFPGELKNSFQTGWNSLNASAWHLAAAYGLADPRVAAEGVAESNRKAQALQAKAPDYVNEFNKMWEEEGGDVDKAAQRFTSSYDSIREGKVLQALKDFAVGGATTIGETIDLIGASAVRPKGLVYTTTQSLAHSFPSLLTGWAGAQAGALVGAGAGTAFFPGVGTAAGAAAGGTAGFVGGSFAGGVPTEVGGWMNEALTKRGFDLTNPEDIMRAYSDPSLMAQVRGEAERKGVTTAAVDSLFNAFAGKLASRGVSRVGKAAGAAADIGVQATGEAASEFSGQVAANKGDISKVSFAESIQEGIASLGHSMGEVAVTGAKSARAAFSTNPVKAASEVATRTQEAIQTQHDSQALVEVAQAVKESKLSKRMPQKIRELVELATEGGAQTVYFQPDEWDSYWSSKGQSPVQAAENLMDEGSKLYHEAKNTGGMIAVPMADYIAKVAPTEDFEGLHASARTAIDGMSVKEAQEHMASLPATMEDLAREALGPEDQAQQPELVDTSTQVRDNIIEQLKATGMDDQTARTNASIPEAIFRTLSQRTGIDAAELYKQYGLRIGNGQGSQDQNQTVMEQPAKWEEEGYKIKHRRAKDGTLVVTASLNGKQVGRAEFDPMGSNDVEIDADHQRKGLATALYDKADQVLGAPVQPSGYQTEDGKKFWASRKKRTSYDQAARSVYFPVTPTPDGRLNVDAAEGMNAQARMTGKNLAIENVQANAKYQGVTQDMIRSFEKAAVSNKLDSMTALADQMSEDVVEAFIAQGFQEMQRSSGERVLLKDIRIKTFNQDAIKKKWEEEGYSFKQDVTQDADGQLHRVTAFDRDGRQVGQALFIAQQSKDLSRDVLVPYNVEVDPEHRRKGLATAMYVGAEKAWARPIETNNIQDKDGKAFWAQPNRPFGRTTFNQDQVEDPLVIPTPAAPAFYSKMVQTIEQKMAKSAPPKDVLGLIKEIKEEERKWSGIEEFLAGKEKVSKDELLEFLRANQLQIQEVTKGAVNSTVDDIVSLRLSKGTWIAKFKDGYEASAAHQEGDTEEQVKSYIVDIRNDDREGNTKYSQYTLPGGENYREVLFTLPDDTTAERTAEVKVKKMKNPRTKKSYNFYEVYVDGEERNSYGSSVKEEAEAYAAKIKNSKKSSGYKSGHWDEANILAFVRLNDRVDADGKRVLFVEEVQSDWHQEGRKKGYKGDVEEQVRLRAEVVAFEDKIGLKPNDYTMGEAKVAAQAKGISTEEFDKFWTTRRQSLAVSEGVPDAPFKKTWHEFALKKILRQAAEQGYERVAWTTGEQQADRYDLSKQLNSIEYQTNEDGTYNIQAYSKHNTREGNPDMYKNRVPKSELSDLIGKEMAEKIVAGEGKSRKGPGGQYKELAGLDLKVGGEGMKGFYDKIIPDYLNKFGKKFGAKVGETTLQTGVAEKFVITNVGKRFQVGYADNGDPTGNSFATREEAEAYVKANSSQADQANVHSIDITNEMRKSVLEQGFTLFQDGPPQGPRGQISFGSGRQFNIDLLKGADFSTFSHEMGHFYLEVLGDLASAENATDQIKQDYQTILKWMGVDSREKIEVKHHEMWARGFEAYLMEGKAPTASLNKIFARFKVWMTSVYRNLRNLNVSLTPEVRDVMNRMLATEEELQLAEADIQPLFKDPSTFGMTGSKAEAYLKAREDAHQAASERVTRKLMEAHKREREAWYKEQKAQVKEAVTQDVSSQNLYKAIERLQAEDSEIKLDRTSIVTEYGAEFAKKLPRGVFQTRAKGDGIHHNVLAGMLGFESGDDLLVQMANAPKKDVLIDQLVDARMAELYPDPMLSDAISEEAVEAVHNDKRSQLLRLELEHMASNDMPVLKEVMRRVAKRVPSDKAVKDNAKRIIGSRKVNEIKPNMFLRAEAKAARQAGELLAQGDFDGAFEAKTRELLNHELYRSAIEAQEAVDKALDKFKRLNKKDEILAKTRDMDLVNTARALLSMFGLGRANKPAGSYLDQIKRYDPDTYETVVALIQGATENVGPYNQVRFDDFVAMKDTVDALWDLAKSSKQMEIDGKLMDRDQIKADLQDRLGEITSTENRVGYEKAASQWDKVKMGLMGIRAALRRVESWADAMDGGNPQGPFRKYLFEPIMDGTTKYREAKKTYLQKYLELVKGIEKSLTFKEIHATELNYRFKDKAELLGAMLHSGNESNLTKLLKGRGWAAQSLDGTVDASKWQAFVGRMIKENVLTKADFDYLQATWDLLEELKPQAQAAHKKMYGHYFNEVTANPVSTPWGEYRGGYVPAMADPFLAQDAAIRAEKESLEKSNNSFMFPTAGRGFTKKRVENYAAPLLMDLRLIPQHLDKVLRFVHIEPHVKQVGRLVMDRQFRKSLDAFDPTVGGDMLVPWLQRSAQQKVSHSSQGWGGKAADTIFREIRTRTGLQVMTANVVNTLQQVTGLSMAAVKVQPKFLRNALWSYVRGPGKFAADVSEKSPFMRTRVTAQSMEVQNQIDDLLLDPSKYEKARDFALKHGYFLQAGAQNIVDLIVWSGAYDEAAGQGVTEAQAVKQADAAVRQTQGSFNAEDVSRFETGTPFVRAFTMFYSYFNMQSNLMGTEFIKIVRDMGLRKGAGKALYIYTFGFMIPAVLSEALVRSMSGKGADEDDDDSYLDDFMSMFFGSQLRTATAFFPFVGPAVNAGINSFNDRWYDDKLTTSPAVSMIESAVKSPKSVYDAVTGDGSKKKAVRDTLSAVGLLTGLPMAPLARPIGYGIDVAEGNAEPTGPVDFARGLVTGHSGQ